MDDLDCEAVVHVADVIRQRDDDAVAAAAEEEAVGERTERRAVHALVLSCAVQLQRDAERRRQRAVRPAAVRRGIGRGVGPTAVRRQG